MRYRSIDTASRTFDPVRVEVLSGEADVTRPKHGESCPHVGSQI